MKRNWYHVAWAEYLVMTARIRSHRNEVMGGLFIFSMIWALIITPVITSFLLHLFGTQIESLLFLGLAGFMRSLVMFMWFVYLFTPLSYSLEELKIGQWEIILSNNVSTRSIMVGTFLGRLPLYTIGFFFLIPVILSSFIQFYMVSVFGQLLLYLTLLLVFLSTLWLSSFLSMAIQSKLAESSRGDELARGLSIVIGFASILPLYSIIFLSGSVATILGLNIFLLFPFTWGADLATSIVLRFNTIGLELSTITRIESMLGFTPTANLSLLVLFTLVIVVVTLATSDRYVRLQIGVRSEQVRCAGTENILLRGIRRILPGSFSVLLISTLKDFGRKPSNTSKVVIGILLAVVLPLLVNSSGLGSESRETFIFTIVLASGMIIAMISAMTFGGTGFLDSKDQQWMLKSAPHGVERFVRARILEALLFGFPMTLIASIIIMYTVALSFIEFSLILITTSIAMSGAVLVSTGVTTNNPNYEDTQSKSFKDNTGIMMSIIMFSMIIVVPFSIVPAFRDFTILSFLPSSLLLVIGIILTSIGTKRMANPE